MQKKFFSWLLTVCMVLSFVPATVLATDGTETLSETSTEYVAKIGDNTYATFNEAITDANAMTGEVNVEIYGEVEFTNGKELNGSYSAITFTGKNDTAKITINQTAGGDYLEAHSKTVAFNNLILAKANPAWSGNSGHMGNYFSIQGGTVTYTECTFPNGACTSTGTATYNSCTFNNAGEYGLWVYDDAIVTVNGGTINSKKGIKVYSEGEDSVTSTLTVQNATFTENVTAKPAVAIGYAEAITLIGNTYNNTTGVLELDSGSDADCNGITFVAQDAQGSDIASTLTAVDRSNSNAACGVLLDGKIYTTVVAAAKDATSGSTVTLLHDTTDTVELPAGVTLNTNGHTAADVTVATTAATMNGKAYTSLQAAIDEAAKTPGSYEIILASGTNSEDPVIIHQTEGVNITIKGNNTDTIFTGYIEVYGHCRYNGAETLTFDGVVFQTSEKDHVFIEQTCQTSTSESAAKCYPHNITVQNCTFTATGDALNTAVGMKYRYGYNIKVADTTATGMHSLMQNYAGVGLTIEEVAITGGKNGIALGTSQNVSVTGLNVEATGYGLRVDAQLDTTITVEDCDIEAFIPVVVRKVEKNVDIVFNGTNTMTETNTDGLWCAIGTSEYEANGEKPTEPTGTVNVVLNDTNLAQSGVYGAQEIIAPVAQIGSKTYMKLEDAIKEAISGDIVVLLNDVSVENASGNGVSSINVPAGVTIDGDNHTITFDGIYYGSANAAFHSTTGSYTVKDVTVELTNNNTNGFAFDMRYGGTLENVTVNANFAAGVFADSNTTIKGCTFNTAINGSYYGVSTDGAPDNVVIEDCVFNGNRAAMLYGTNVTFTGNTVNGDKGLSVATTSGTVSGNTFNGARAMSVSKVGTTISENIISENSCVEFSVNADLSGNYWGGEAPSENQLVSEGGAEALVVSYYTTVEENGTLSELVRTDAFTIRFDANGGECEIESLITGEGGILSELPDATRTGYTFDGWYDGTEKVDTDTVFAEDTELTAKWTVNSYSVTLVTNGGVIRSDDVTEYTYGVGAALPANITRSGYSFGGWYDNAACTGRSVSEITADDIGDKTFYAKWMYNYMPHIPSDRTYTPVIEDSENGNVSVTPTKPEKGDTVTVTPIPDEGYEIDAVIVTNKNGNPVTVIDNGDGTYSFVQPTDIVTVTVTFKAMEEETVNCQQDNACPMYSYTDLDMSLWYHDGIHYCIENGLMGSTDADELIFEPNTATTRAMIVTILWRLEGSPVVNYAMTFEDVDADAWYTEAVRWAQYTDLVTGYSEAAFGPSDIITREQMVTILWRYCKHNGIDVSVGENTDILSYGDAFAVSEWAIDAMQWSCGSGMIRGIADGDIMNLEPIGSATRAHVATILHRFCTLILSK